MKTSDIIGAALIAIGVMMTGLMYFAMHHPASDVESVEVHEIPAPTPRSHGISDKSQIKLSEARPIVRHYVEEIDRDAQERGLEAMSEKQKAEMIESIIDNMKKQGAYEFVE